jgi:TRAP-type C4-dicarboxylate transport system permease small subunit
MGIIRWLDDKAEEVICVFLLAVLVFLLGLGVTMRFIFSSAFAWQEEVVRFIYVWLSYFGVSLGAKKGAHIRILTFVTLLPPGAKIKIMVVSDVIWVIFNLMVVYISIDLLKLMMQFRTVSPVLEINQAFAYVIIPVSMVLTTLRIVQSYLSGKNLRSI